MSVDIALHTTIHIYYKYYTSISSQKSDEGNYLIGRVHLLSKLLLHEHLLLHHSGRHHARVHPLGLLHSVLALTNHSLANHSAKLHLLLMLEVVLHCCVPSTLPVTNPTY